MKGALYKLPPRSVPLFFQKKGTDNRGAEEFLLVPWIIRMGGRNMMTVYWITGMVCMRKTPPEPKYFQNRHIRDTRKTISKVLDYTPCQNKNPRTEATHSGRKVNNQGRGFHPLNSSIWLHLQVLHKICKSTRSRGPIDDLNISRIDTSEIPEKQYPRCWTTHLVKIKIPGQRPPIPEER